MSTETDGRETLIARLHAMADWLQAHPDIPLSKYSEVIISAFPGSLDDARDAMDSAPGGWTKTTSPASGYISYARSLADRDSYQWRVTYQMSVSKDKSPSCTRVQVGTKYVEAHEQPVYEWQCNA